MKLSNPDCLIIFSCYLIDAENKFKKIEPQFKNIKKLIYYCPIKTNYYETRHR